jgi:hypothetical protein
MMIKLRHALIFLGIAALAATVFNNCSAPTPADNSSGGTAANFGLLPSSSLAHALPITGTEPNVMPITMSQQWFNAPTVSVTVCQHGTSTCQTISNVLVDTGSTGLRIFSQALSVPLAAATDGSGNALAECYQFGSGEAFWGQVEMADVTLGGETLGNMRVQLMESTYKSVPSSCTQGGTFTVSASPADDGFNGILGIQPFKYDCGTDCTPGSWAAVYYSCPSSSSACTGLTLPEAQQVPNPVAMMAVDNNGYAVQIPNTSPAGAVTLGQTYLVFGIGTQANNLPVSATALPVDTFGNMQTNFAGVQLPYSSIDTGSEQYYFDPPSGFPTPQCQLSDGQGGSVTLYCPSTLTTYSAVLEGSSGNPQLNINFELFNGQTAWMDPNNVLYPDLGQPISDGALEGDGAGVSQMFLWGFPLFYGKTIFFGMENVSTVLGTGPFNAL